MNIDAKKLCWNCETGVLVSQENCISCGVYLSPHSSFELNQIFIPPYRVRENEENEILEKTKIAETATFEEETDVKAIVLSVSLLLLGSLFFLFSLLMLFFGENGKLTLSWNANYWYLYALFSPFLLFLGWKKLRLLA
ncbi:MAG TPA: hypothetical protein PLC42_01865 [Parachlamydiaceae bacterium]|nr:hypothetical protein [Parachlamydiaceae bacterium]